MARKTDTGTNNSAPDRAGSGKDLKAFRQQIDKLDLQILELINKRAALAGQIGKVKSATSEHVYSPAREEEVLQNVLASNKGPLGEATIRAIFREIISGSRALQKALKVAFLGPEYSFSHLAALSQYGSAVEYVALPNIASIFEELNRRHIDYGVVPLENSTDGRIADTLEMFIRMPQVRVCSEVKLQVHHNLLATCEQTEIRRVYSKPQALSQCRNWLSKNLPQATLHEVSSTAAAAQFAQRDPGTAAIASREASVRYGVRILFANIEDSPFNETRFAVIGPHPADKSGSDKFKTAVMFEIPNSPGELADILAIFKQNKVNLTWIESFPTPESKGQYVFFVDFEGHTDDPKVKKTLGILDNTCDKVTVLGSFTVGNPIE